MSNLGTEMAKCQWTACCNCHNTSFKSCKYTLTMPWACQYFYGKLLLNIIYIRLGFWQLCYQLFLTRFVLAFFKSKPLLRRVHWESSHDCTHLQDNSCITGAGEPHIQLTASLPSSSVIQPQSVRLAWNYWLCRPPPDRSLIVCTQHMHEEAVHTRMELTLLSQRAAHTGACSTQLCG
jgi:hypothetical protein